MNAPFFIHLYRYVKGRGESSLLHRIPTGVMAGLGGFPFAAKVQQGGFPDDWARTSLGSRLVVLAKSEG